MAGGYEVTSMGTSPTADRAHRMRVYFIAMSVRVACVGSLAFVRGWWLLIVGVAAVVLPYFAVLIANQAAHNPGGTPEVPTPREVAAPPTREPRESAADTLLVFDAPAERRSQQSAQTDEAHEPPSPGSAELPRGDS